MQHCRASEDTATWVERIQSCKLYVNCTWLLIVIRSAMAGKSVERKRDQEWLVSWVTLWVCLSFDERSRLKGHVGSGEQRKRPKPKPRFLESFTGSAFTIALIVQTLFTARPGPHPTIYTAYISRNNDDDDDDDDIEREPTSNADFMGDKLYARAYRELRPRNIHRW